MNPEGECVLSIHGIYESEYCPELCSSCYADEEDKCYSCVEGSEFIVTEVAGYYFYDYEIYSEWTCSELIRNNYLFMGYC